MLKGKNSSVWPIASALLMSFCSSGDSPSPSSPSNVSVVPSAADNALAGARADGDVKVGTGPLEIVRLRMDRQSAPGVLVLRQFANPGGVYVIRAGETIELWAEYPSTVANPRFKVEWGDGSSDFTGCGSCLLAHRYSNDDVYTVRASLDDLVSTRVTRTFVLNASTQGATAAIPGGTVRTTAGGALSVQYALCGNGSPGSCTAAAARSSCQAIGRRVVSHASDGSSTVVSLGAALSCQWSISYFTVDVQMPAGSCLVGVSNLDWNSCCTLAEWHGNTVAFGAPGATFGYVDPGNSGYNGALPNVAGERWGCVPLAQSATNLGGCTQQYVACAP